MGRNQSPRLVVGIQPTCRNFRYESVITAEFAGDVPALLLVAAVLWYLSPHSQLQAVSA